MDAIKSIPMIRIDSKAIDYWSMTDSTTAEGTKKSKIGS